MQLGVASSEGIEIFVKKIMTSHRALTPSTHAFVLLTPVMRSRCKRKFGVVVHQHLFSYRRAPSINGVTIFMCQV